MLKKISSGLIIFVNILFVCSLVAAQNQQSENMNIQELMEKGQRLLEMEEYDEAVKVFSRIITTDYGNYEAYKQIGNVYYLQKKFKQALSYYEKSIVINPKFALSYNNIGLIYRDTGDLEKSLIYFNQAIEIQPTLSNAFYNRALVYETKTLYDLALKDYLEVLRLKPQDEDIYESIREVYKKNESYKTIIKSDINFKSGKVLDKIYLPETLFRGLNKTDRVNSLIDFVNECRQLNIKEQVPANALQSYWVDYYQQEILNGGIPQFIFNSQLDSNIIAEIRNGLRNMKAENNLKLFEKLLSRINKKAIVKNIAKFQTTDNYARFVKTLPVIIKKMNTEFYKIKETEDILDANYQFIGAFKNLEFYK